MLKHLMKVQRQSVFYRELWRGRPLTEWRHFPIINKTKMMDHFDQLNTAGISKQDAFEAALRAEHTREFSPMIGSTTIGLSSGTSGNRGLFVISRKERLAWAGTVLAKVLPGSLFAKHRIAFFLRANSNLYGSVEGGRLKFDFYDLLDPMAEHVSRLQADPPTLLVAPPSMLRLLADLQLSGGLHLQPQRVISVAEVLDPMDQQRIAAAFGMMVHQVYQCTEGFLASSCEYGTLHLNEDLVYIQKDYIDSSSGRFIPIISDFSRLTQPIIRYRINDILTEAEAPCPCGSKHTPIARIEGRYDDIFVFPAVDTKQWVRVFPDFISRILVISSDKITAYQAIQHAPDLLELCLQVGEDDEWMEAEDAIRNGLVQLCERVGCQIPQLRFTPYSFAASDRKLRRVERRFSLDDNYTYV